MREIKFRAWDKSAATMLNSVHNTYDWELMPVDKSEDESFALMQYTGLKDKNGKEIYEGDILSNNSHLMGVMEWEEARGAWSRFLPMKEFSVIGNIYENPELLKETNK